MTPVVIDVALEIAAERKRLRLTRPEPLEAQVLREVMRALSYHPKVARCWRMNTGGAYLPASNGRKQFVRFGFTGSPDIYGFMRDGKALYVECKRPSGKLDPEQAAFIDIARNFGCVAFVARSVDDVMEALA